MDERGGSEATPTPGPHEPATAAEGALAASEAQLRMAIDAARMGTFEWELDSGTLRWNRNHADIFGLDLDQSTGTWAAFAKRIHPDDSQALDAAVNRALHGGGDFEVEYRIVRPDGGIRWTLSRGQVLVDDAGRPTRVIGTTLDTTESRTVRERIARAFESIDDAFCAFDHGLRLTFANREAQRVIGGDPLLGRPLLDVLPRAIGAAHERDYERAVTDNLVVEFEAYHPELAAWFEVRAYPALDGLFVYMHDISERRTAQAEVTALSARLQAGLLPTPSISDPRLAIHTRYRAGEDRLLLGGDFFDAVERPDATFTVLIGDVSGHGADAAALGATLRAAWRGLALTLPDPVAMVRALDAVFSAERPSVETFATVCCAWIPPDRHQATFVVAGHPPPLLLSDRAERIELPSGPPLGLGGARTGTTVSLPCAWTLLFYTDGLIEARSGPRPSSERFGEQGLLEHLAALPNPASLDGTGLDDLLSHVQQVSGEGFADDVAVLLVRHHPDAVEPEPPTARPRRQR
ncbi:MAG TPA: SpoIIE family protein phosphatase [Actinomycetota bacterium]|nr:SpoIIE family protein phosphatase [Actinomycetota bacterium]